MRLAFVFPGQGSQAVGMGKALYDAFPEVRAMYEEGSDALGYDVAALSFEGPREGLDRTENTQPCLLLAGAAAYRAATLKGLEPMVVAGHSLGEYTALYAAGVMGLADALRLTRLRGRLMQEAVPEGRGLMAAVLGLDAERVAEGCAMVRAGYVAPANYNCPGQVVISGEREAVEEALGIMKGLGAKRAVPLSVSVPSHSRLMEPASRELGRYLDGGEIALRGPRVPVVTNADAAEARTVGAIKDALVRQLSGPVLWEQSVRRMAAMGVEGFVELGPGKVLGGLIKRTVDGARIYNVEDAASLGVTVEGLS